MNLTLLMLDLVNQTDRFLSHAATPLLGADATEIQVLRDGKCLYADVVYMRHPPFHGKLRMQLTEMRRYVHEYCNRLCPETRPPTMSVHWTRLSEVQRSIARQMFEDEAKMGEESTEEDEDTD